MSSLSPPELKKRLLELGFEVYRTLEGRVVLADRVRDNLIMDSGVSVESTEGGFVILIVFRAQGSDFAGETPERLLARAHDASAVAQAAGFGTPTVGAVLVHDPGDSSKVIDTWQEVSVSRQVSDAELQAALSQALGFPKAATR